MKRFLMFSMLTLIFSAFAYHPAHLEIVNRFQASYGKPCMDDVAGLTTATIKTKGGEIP